MVGGADQPSEAVFPGGESMAAMQARSVAAIRRHDAALEAEHGAGAVWVAVTHGDIIKSVLADALGMDLDLFQRITVNPGSVSIIRYGTDAPRGRRHQHRLRRPVLAARRRSGRRRAGRGRRRARAAARSTRKMGDMPTLVHQFDWPDRVVVGTVGRPGSRTFYLQVRDGARSASVALEKEQSAVLAEKIDEILDALMADEGNRFSVPADTPAELVDNDPLDQPVEEEFRAGLMRLGWDPSTAQVVVEAFPFVETDRGRGDRAGGPSEMLLVRMPVGTARAFVQRTRQVVRSGRPLCPLCGEPVDDDGHVCGAPDDRDGDEVDLVGGELELVGRITVASNATFLATIGDVQVVYKPVAGERPLWDFPDGTLANREVAAYLVSEAFGWDVVPVTFLRDGPLGPGMVQLWQEPDPAQDPVDVVPARAVPPEGWRAVFQGIDDDDQPLTLIHEDSPALRRMAVFDVVVNNADRKGGHILPTPRRPPLRRRPRRQLPRRAQAADGPVGLAGRRARRRRAGGRGTGARARWTATSVSACPSSSATTSWRRWPPAATGCSARASSPARAATCRRSRGRSSEPSPLVVATPAAEGAVAARAQVGADDRGAQVVGLGRDDGAARPPGHGVDEPREARVVAEPEERRARAQARRAVELAHRERDRHRVAAGSRRRPRRRTPGGRSARRR